MLALRSDGVTPPHEMLAWLAAQQDADGGFSFAGGGGGSDIDDTGAALEALGRGRVTLEPRRSGICAATRTSTAASRASRAAVERPVDRLGGRRVCSRRVSTRARCTAAAPSRRSRFLRSLIGGDGHVRYSRTSDQTPVWVTGAGADGARSQAAAAGARAPPDAPRRRGRSGGGRDAITVRLGGSSASPRKAP